MKRLSIRALRTEGVGEAIVALGAADLDAATPDTIAAESDRSEELSELIVDALAAGCGRARA